MCVCIYTRNVSFLRGRGWRWMGRAGTARGVVSLIIKSKIKKKLPSPGCRQPISRGECRKWVSFFADKSCYPRRVNARSFLTRFLLSIHTVTLTLSASIYLIPRRDQFVVKKINFTPARIYTPCAHQHYKSCACITIRVAIFTVSVAFIILSYCILLWCVTS